MTFSRNIPLAPYTTFRIGGPAEVFTEASTEDQLLAAFFYATREGLAFTLLGSGSNVLISDEGLRGLTVINQHRGIRLLGEDRLWVASGTPLEEVVEVCAEYGLEGMESLVGIPGTVGGAVCGNAGAYGRWIGEFVRSARLMNANGAVDEVDQDFLSFDYRSSVMKTDRYWMLDVVLSGFARNDKLKIVSKMTEIREERSRKLPSSETACAGSFFKNLPPEAPGERRRAIGAYLDQAGAKTLRVGGASVSPIHANVIVNSGSATARDVLELARRMASLVKERFGISVAPEVRFLGPGLLWEEVE